MIKRLLLGLFSVSFLAISSTRLLAQNVDGSVGVDFQLAVNTTVEFEGELDVDAQFLAAQNWPSGSISYSVIGSGQLTLNPTLVKVIPGKVYTVAVTMSTGTAGPGYTTKVAPLVWGKAPPGYQVWMSPSGSQPLPTTELSLGAAGINATVTVDIVVIGPEQLAAKAGVSSSIISGEVFWQVALGSLKNGSPAGSIVLGDPGTGGSWASLCTTGPLQCPVLSKEVTTILDSNGALRQVLADEADVDIVTINSSSYELRFYNPKQMTTGTPYNTFSGLPFVTYNVSQGGTSTSLKITKTTHPASSLATGGPLTTAADTGNPTASIATSTLSLNNQSSGSTVNATWTLNDWYYGANPVVTETRVWSGTTSARTETRTVQTGGTTGLSVQKNFVLESWGEEMVNVTPGSSSPNQWTRTDAFNTSTSNWFHLGTLTSSQSTDGTWASYAYTANDFTVSNVYRPFDGAPSAQTAVPSGVPSTGEYSTINYSVDPFGALTRPGSTTPSTVYRNGVLVSQSTAAYQDLSSQQNGMTVTQATNVVSTNATSSLTSYHKFYREDSSDDFYRSQSFSDIGPDGAQESYVALRGDYTAGTGSGTAFVQDGSGQASCVGVITGNNAALSGYSSPSFSPTSTQITSYLGSAIDPIYLISGKSTLKTVIRDKTAHVVRTETWAWLSGGWQLVDYTSYTYDDGGFLTGKSSMNGAAWSASYNGDQMASETDAAGVTLNYSYDSAGRRYQETKTGASYVTTYSYDAAGRLTQTSKAGGSDSLSSTVGYDTAGRLTSTKPAGLGTTNIAYSYNGTGFSETITFPDGGTKTENFQNDGTIASVTGNAIVPQYFSYALDSTNSGYLDVAVAYDGNGYRKVTTVFDWVGRTYSTSRPTFQGGSNYVETNSYDGSGHLTETTRTGLAPIRYGNFDGLGNATMRWEDLSSGAVDTQPTPGSNDRLTYSDQWIESYNSAYWAHHETGTYPVAASATYLPIGVARTRLTGFSSPTIADSRVSDVYNNTVEKTVSVPGSAQMIVTATIPGMHSVVSTFTNGVQTSVVGTDGYATSFTPDALERIAQLKDSRGNTTTTAFVPGSTLPSTVTDAANAVTQYNSYDGLGRPLQVTDAGNYVSNVHYNTLGKVDYKYGTGCQPETYIYDGYGALSEMDTFQLANYTGAAPTTGSKQGNWTVWNNDPYTGLLISKTDDASHVTSFSYNVRGQIASKTLARTTTSGAAISTIYAYYGDAGEPATGELKNLSYTDNSASAVAYSYTRTGQLATVGDAAGTRTFNYGIATGAPATELDSISLGAFYNAQGNQRTISRLYNSDSLLPGRPTGFEVGTSYGSTSDLFQQYTYNSLGQFSSLTTKTAGSVGTSSAYNYTYRSDSSLVQQVTGPNYTANYGYDTYRNLRTQVQTLAGATVATEFDYHYNALRQRDQAQQLGSAFQDYYTGVSNYSAVTNGYTYDGFGQLTSAIMYTGALNTSGTTPQGTQIPGRRFIYSYDTSGNRLSFGEFGTGADNQSPANALNQLASTESTTVRVLGNAAPSSSVSVNGSTASKLDRNYGYDISPSNSSGPATGTATVTAGGSTVNRNYFVGAFQQTLSYDNDGNLSYDGTWDYVYDAEDRLSAMVCALGSGFPQSNLTITFTYDYLGRRIEKKVFNTSTNTTVWDRRFLYDGDNIVGEIDPSTGNLLRSYSWGIDLYGTLRATAGVGALAQVTNVNYSGSSPSSTTGYSPSYDGNGNVASLIRTDGFLSEVYEYSPYGEPLRAENFDSAIADNPIRFSSKYRDSETGLSYYGARYFSPALGRFINRDPIAEAGGSNLYGFCRNDPIGGVDIRGWTDASRASSLNAGYHGTGGTTYHYPVTTSSKMAYPGYAAAGSLDSEVFWSTASQLGVRVTAILPTQVGTGGGPDSYEYEGKTYIKGNGEFGEGYYEASENFVPDDSEGITAGAWQAAIAGGNRYAETLVHDVVAAPKAVVDEAGAIAGFVWNLVDPRTRSTTVQDAISDVDLFLSAPVLGSRVKQLFTTPEGLAHLASGFVIAGITGTAAGAETTGFAAETAAAETGADAAATLPSKLYHYTGAGNADSILENGLQLGNSGKVFTTTAGDLTPLQAQIELALPANRGLPGALFEIDTSALPQPLFGPGRVLPTATAPGGGVEVIFGQPIPPSALTRVW